MNTPNYTYHDYRNPDPPKQPHYLQKLLRHLKKESHIETILDAGCGDGNFTASVAEVGGYKLYGVDLSSGGIGKAKTNYPQIKFAQSSLYEDLCSPFQEVEMFDAIISVEVIEHLYSPNTYMKRANEALRPGGLLILTTPYWGYLKNILLAVTNRMDRALTALWEGGHIKHWSYRTLRTLGEQRGFEFIAFEGAGPRTIPFLWSGMLMVFRKPVASSEKIERKPDN